MASITAYVKYDQQWKDAEYLEERQDGVLTMVRGNSKEPCMYCGEPTSWVDVELLSFVCSRECDTMLRVHHNGRCDGG